MILDFFTNIFNALNRQDNHVLILAVYLCVTAVVIALRVLARSRYSAAALAVSKETPHLKEREDIKKIRSTLLRNAIAAYKQVADASVTRVPTAQIVERQVDKLHFAGWRYAGMAAFVEGFESGLLWVGVLLAVIFNDWAHVYGVTAVVVFLLLRLCASFFDFRAVRARLCDEMLIYIEREVGRFYASDAGGAVLRLKTDLMQAHGRQAELFNNSMDRLVETLSANAEKLNETLRDANKDIHTQIAKAIDEKLVRMNEDLAQASAAWEKSLTQATTVQGSINQSADAIAKASGKLQSAAELLAAHLQGHSNALSEQLVQLVRAVESMKDAQLALTQQGQYIERNQKTLEETLHAYEMSMQNLAQHLGESLGAFVNLHAQTSAQAVNDALRGNIEKIMQLARQSGDAR
ncbi:MAG: apolipoprotein A1/A4/E family protein [Defluviitaleaceae bacterium]|nr:apolipoprotein A1/A4/E family protein [Defluviitaleaceae bacterium]